MSLSLVILGFLPFVGSAAQGEPLTFSAKGEIAYEAYLPDGTERRSFKDFTVAVLDCRWKIECMDAAIGDYSAKAGGGGLVYDVTRVNRQNNPALNDWFVTVTTNDVPSPVPHGVSVLWLAFASSCYLRTVEGDQYRPVWHLDDPRLWKEGYTMGGELEKLDNGLPRRLQYLNQSGLIRAKVRGNPAVIRASQGFQGALTNAIYRVLETTNIGSTEIPKSIVFERFAVRPDFTTSIKPIERITATVRSVAITVEPDDLNLEVSGRAFVNDFRFERSRPDIGAVSYTTTNFGILSSNALMNLR